MCTAISYRKQDHYFGRNLDLEFSFNEKVVITPRNHLFALKNGAQFRNQFALMGMAIVQMDFPLYYEAANESGLAMAGLRFAGNAYYNDPVDGKDNITAFELIPWILGQAETVAQVRGLLENLNITNIPFSPQFPSSPLHFMISDKQESIVVEPMKDGLHIYDNPYDVMTNNPPFDYHIWNMQQYLNLSPKNEANRFSPRYDLTPFSGGMGAFGLPGDTSSASRFVRTAFNLANSYNDDTELDNVTQFFHVLDSVAFLKGCTLTDDGKRDITLYSCCINTDQLIFYYKTYDNNQISAIQMLHEDLDGKELKVYDLVSQQQINYQN